MVGILTVRKGKKAEIAYKINIFNSFNAHYWSLAYFLINKNCNITKLLTVI